MALEGLLSQIDLATLLQTLRMEEQEGILYLTRYERKVNLFVSKEGVRYLPPEKEEYTDLIEVLFRHRFVKRDELEEYKRKQKRSRTPLGELLLQDGKLTDDDMEQVMAPFFSEKIFEIFDWREGNFRFENTPPINELEFFDPEEGGPFLTFEISFLNLELVRRRDEWQKMRELLPSDECIFVIDEENMASRPYDKEEFEKDHRKILHLLDGKKNIAQLREHSGMSKFATYTVLYDLYDQGVIKLLDVTYLLEEAEKFYREDRILEGNQRYNAAIKINPNNMKLRISFARRCMETKNIEGAAEQFVAVGPLLAREGKEKEAHKSFQKALELCPNNLEFSMQYFFFLFHQGADDTTLQDLGKKTGLGFMQQRNYKKSQDIYQALRKRCASDLHCRKQLVEIYQQLRQRPSLPKVYEEMADIYMARGDYKGAYESYKNLCKITPNREDIQQKMKGLEQFISMSSKVSRRKYKWVALYLFIISGLVYLGYSYTVYKYGKPQHPKAVEFGVKIQTLRKNVENIAQRAGSQKKNFTLLLQELVREKLELKSLLDKINLYILQDPGLRKLEGRGKSLAERIEKLNSRIIFALQKENEEMAVKAQKLEGENQLEEALELYQKVLSSSHNFPKIPPRIREKIGPLTKAVSKIQKEVGQLRQILKKKDFSRAFEETLKFFKAYGNTRSARNFGLPLYLEAYPPGSDIFFDSTTKVQKSPSLFLYFPAGKYSLKISHNGYKTFELTFKVSLAENLEITPLFNSYNIPAEKLIQNFTKGRLEIPLVKEPLWRKTIPGAKKFYFIPAEKYLVAVANLKNPNQLEKTNLMVYEVATGKLLSQYTVEEASCGALLGSWQSTPRLFLASGKILYGLDLQQGGKIQLAWTRMFNKTFEGISKGVSEKGYFALVAEGGYLYIIHPEDGREIRRFPTFSPFSGSPRIIGENLYFACRDGRVYGQKVEGGEFWQKDFSSILTSPPAIENEVLCIGNEEGKVYAANPLKDRELWTFSDPGRDGKVRANLLWGEELLLYKSTSSIHHLYSLKAGDGEKIWYKNLSEAISFWSLQGSSLFLAQGKTMAIYSLTQGKKPTVFWKITLNGSLTAPPLSLFIKRTNQRALVAGTSDGTIYCFEQ